MRIRRRFPAASVPLADPKLNRSLVVQVQPHTGEQNPHGNLHFRECKTNSQPSDPPNQPSDQGISIADDKPRWVSHGSSTEAVGKMKQKDLEDDRWVEDEKNSNDIRKECTLNAEVDISLLLSSSSSSDRDGRWGEGDKVVPLKKRKGGLERIITKDQENNTAVINTKWKSKTNKKCLMQNGGGGGDDDELQKEKIAREDVDDNGDIGTKTKKKKKKKKRGNVIMEGSRCSRVNGRGWRCWQQTLVGYSLCEHHLGKGRLRSMSSVRNRAMANNSAIAPKHLLDDDDDDESSQAPLSLGEKYKHKKAALLMDHDDHHEDGDDNDEKPSVITTKTKTKKKKKKKLGTVKARSMSSLLGQTDNIAVVAANNPN